MDFQLSSKNKAELLVETLVKVHSSENVSDTAKRSRDSTLARNPEVAVRKNTSRNNLDLPFSLFELKKAVSNSRQTTPGKDAICYTMLAHMSDSSLEVVLKLFNVVWDSGKIPAAWKQSVFVPILKVGSAEEGTLWTRFFAWSLSFNRFTSTFRPLYKKDPQRMESIYKQFIEELRGAIQDDISRLIEEGKLETKLNELDKLESAAKNNTDPAWRPSGVPEQDFCSFLMPYYQKQEAYLRLELKKIQAENAALAQKVLAGRESLSQTDHRISETVEDWKASVTEFEKLAATVCSADVFDV